MSVLARTLTVVIHSAEEGGYWAEVLELPGCVSQGETWEEVQRNIQEAIQAVSQYDSIDAIMPFQPSPAESRLSQPNGL